MGEEESSSCHHGDLEPPLRKPGDEESVSGGASDEEPRDCETPPKRKRIWRELVLME